MDTTGQVAQLVEHRTENPGVGGSIPPLSILDGLVLKAISFFDVFDAGVVTP
jgi:hypothetical protein